MQVAFPFSPQCNPLLLTRPHPQAWLWSLANLLFLVFQASFTLTLVVWLSLKQSKLGACRGVPILGSFADFSWPQHA